MDNIIEIIKARDPHEKEFHQAVTEVMESVQPVMEMNPEYLKESPNRNEWLCFGCHGWMTEVKFM